MMPVNFMSYTLDDSEEGQYDDQGNCKSESIDESLSADSRPGPISYPETLFKRFGMGFAKVIIMKREPTEPN
jgi:hypothetical protein